MAVTTDYRGLSAGSVSTLSWQRSPYHAVRTWPCHRSSAERRVSLPYRLSSRVIRVPLIPEIAIASAINMKIRPHAYDKIPQIFIPFIPNSIIMGHELIRVQARAATFPITEPRKQRIATRRSFTNQTYAVTIAAPIAGSRRYVYPRIESPKSNCSMGEPSKANPARATPPTHAIPIEAFEKSTTKPFLSAWS